jgi:hypothetical protein
VLHDDSLKADLEIRLPKPFTTDAIPAFAAVAPLVSQLRESMLVRRWPEMRATILDRFLAGHVERLACKLHATDPGLVAFLDAHVDAVRTASRVLTDFKIRAFRAANLTDVHSYLYWKYSRDVLGKPGGLTTTALERQLGPGHFNVPVQFIFPCPNCYADAECEADGIGELAPDELRMRCSACGHFARHQNYGDDALASHVLCGCSHCDSVTQRVGAELELLQWDLMPSLVSHVLAEIANVAARAAATKQINMFEHGAVDDFVSHWTSGEEGSFAHAVDAWIKRRHPRRIFPLAYLKQAWTLIDALAGTGAVSVEVTYQADDAQQVLEDLMFEQAARVAHDDEQLLRCEHDLANALTTVLKGFALSRPGALAEWLRAVSTIGLFDCWFTLPCDISCRLRPHRLARNAGGYSAPQVRLAEAPARNLQEAIALLRAHGYTVTAPS